MADEDNGNGNGEASEDESGMTTWDVLSDCIATLAYDKKNGVAVYTFQKGGGEYTTPMSIQQATAWAHSPSVGAYFNENIKGVYGKSAGR